MPPASPDSEGGIPLTSRAVGEALFRAPGKEVTRELFLRHVADLARRLPERRHALNLCQNRYRFLVAFAACLLRGQASLLTSDRSPHRLRQLALAYPDSYSIGDGPELPYGSLHVEAVLGGEDGPEFPVPSIPAGQTAAIVFTSGSTGDPVAHVKPWGALAASSEAASAAFGFGTAGAASIIGTVPPQHMYGFETTVLLPLHAGVSSFAGTTFFPQDVADALMAVPAPRVLVTTPLQIRALLSAGPALPELAAVISATAPLAPELAREAEAAWTTRVLEIFGATEVGSIASRRTVEGELWRTYRSVELIAREDGRTQARVAGLGEIMLADRLDLAGPTAFRLLGREADLVKLAGKRASLAGLNAILCRIDGVEDGAFLAPEEDGSRATRLTAFVVAPTRSADGILADLRTRIEPPFLPRRIVKVPALPRNDVGKIQRSALLDLQAGAA